jgi:pilus assembly protein CpaB
MFLLKPNWMIPIAIITGVLATLGVYRFLQNQKQVSHTASVNTRQVVVATRNLAMGTKLDATMIRQAEWPADLVTEGTFTRLDSLQDRVVRTDIFTGEAILESKLAPRGSASGFLGLIPPGMRAMTVAVNVVSGVSGFILPNTRVDVLVTVTPSTDKEQATSRMILEDIQVLAVDQTFRNADDHGDPITVQSVTLLVTPDQAEKLALGSNEGKLQLTLRNMIDRQANSSSGIQLKELINSGQRAANAEVRPRVASTPKVETVVEQQPPPRVIEVLRSNVRSEVVLEAGQAKEQKSKK